MSDGWLELKPWRLGVTQEPRITLSIGIMGRFKVPVCYLGLNKPLMEAMSWKGGNLARMELGEGDNAGKLRITEAFNGSFKFGKSTLRYGSSRILFKLPNSPPSRRKSEIVKHEIVGSSVIVELPNWLDRTGLGELEAEPKGWGKPRKAASVAVEAKPSAPPPEPAVPPRRNVPAYEPGFVPGEAVPAPKPSVASFQSDAPPPAWKKPAYTEERAQPVGDKPEKLAVAGQYIVAQGFNVRVSRPAAAAMEFLLAAWGEPSASDALIAHVAQKADMRRGEVMKALKEIVGTLNEVLAKARVEVVKDPDGYLLRRTAEVIAA